MGQNLTTRSQDYSKWYNELVVRADLAENSAVRGCMIIKPYGYAIWERMQAELDQMFKDSGHSNAYFPLFVPKSLFEAEEKNAEGFAKSVLSLRITDWKMIQIALGNFVLTPKQNWKKNLLFAQQARP